jgi:NAD-dependent DNA ligase
MIRDETHRTAVAYHRKRRELRDFTSELTAIPGVGEKRKNRLLRNLGSIQRVAGASVAELSPFVGRKTAEEIIAHFARQRALAAGVEPETETSTDESAGGVIQASSAAIEPEQIETQLDDPEGDAEDLQPIRSVDHTGQVRARRRSTRKRGERSTNPHAVKREKLAEGDGGE